MPNYYNPYNFYPVTYANQMGYSGMPMQPAQMSQQSYATAPAQQGPKMMEWVEGEVGAKAFQMPNGWPANSPIPLWDSTDTVIYLKSWGPMGIPNPMQKLRYEMPEQQTQNLLAAGNGMSGASSANEVTPDMSHYVTKDDLNQMKEEIRKMMATNVNFNQNGSNNGQNASNGNRGGNR